MTEIVFKNQSLTTIIPTRDLSAITDGLIRGTTKIPDDDIVALNAESVFFYSENNLVITLDGGLPNDWFFAGPQVRVNGFFKKSDTSIDGSEFSKYERFETDADVVLYTPGRIVIKINPSDKEEVTARFASLGVSKPDFGLLVVVLRFSLAGSSESHERAYCIKYTHIPLFSSAIHIETIPSSSIQENFYKTGPSSFETFFVPTLSSSFHYNFYENEELNYEIYNSRNYKGYNLEEIPKYIKLQWNVPYFNLDQWTIENSGPSLYLPDFIPPTGSASSPVVPLSTSILTSVDVVVPGVYFGFGASSSDDEGMAAAMAGGARTSADAARTFDGAILGEEGTLDSARDPFLDFVPSPSYTVATNSDYVGYIIEKSRIEEDGTSNVVDLIPISGKNTNQYIDWKISYGEVYSYRIRSVFRYIDYRNISLFLDSDVLLTREQGIQFIDQNMIGYTNKTYYYDGLFSLPSECQTTETERPDAPSDFRVYPKSKEKYILLSWSQRNKNRDVVGFNVYRKKINDSYFIRLNSEVLSIRNNYFQDFDVEPDVDYVYCVESIDFHGNFSKLSAQILSKIKLFSTDQVYCEFVSKLYQIEGFELSDVPKQKQNNLLVAKNGIKINTNPLFSDSSGDGDFILKIKSLDSGMEKELKIKFKTLSIYHTSPYVPEETENLSVTGRSGVLFPGLIFTF